MKYTVYCTFQQHAGLTIQRPVNRQNAFFATVNEMFNASSQLLTAAECAVIKSLSTVQKMKQWSAVIQSWKELPNIWLMVAKKTYLLLKLWILESTCYWKVQKQNCRIPQSLTECTTLNSNQGFYWHFQWGGNFHWWAKLFGRNFFIRKTSHQIW